MALCRLLPYSVLSKLHAFRPQLVLHEPRTSCEVRWNPVRRNSVVVCCSKKPSKRRTRPSKSNDEICDELRELICSMGLLEERLPSIKELQTLGRHDLANIVRRRGYKVLTLLLKNKTMKVDSNSLEAIEAYSASLSEVSEDPSLLNVYSNGLNWSLISKSSSNNSEFQRHSSEDICEKAANFLVTGDLDELEEKFVSKNVPSYHDEQCLDSSDIATSDDQEHDNTDKGLFGEMIADEDNLIEIERLKSLLSRKEEELVKLKQDIEKEKMSLSNLQAKATTEISKVQRSMLAKNVELGVVEESLSELMEVQIEFWVDGQTVDIAGSFNGWHSSIKMDCQYLSETVNPSSSRKSRLWSTVLWLYPGIYEIKFIVDGCWRIDPTRETTSFSGITNNVLRVNQ